VDRLACVDVPALPLQLLLQEHPEWREHPAAVVAEDRPHARLLWVNERARHSRILPGQTYAAALSLDRDLRAGTVAPSALTAGVALLTDRLRRFSPDVEPAGSRPGVFWLDARGLERLFESLLRWAEQLRASLREAGFTATVVAGFTRFGTYAVARSSAITTVFREPSEEDHAARRVGLDRLDLPPDVRDVLARLGVRTVGEFLRLPPGGIRRRFGREAYDLHRLAAGERWAPLQPEDEPARFERRLELPSPDDDAERLLFVLKPLLDSLLSELAAGRLALAALRLRLRLDDRKRIDERLRPAAPTLDGPQLLGLVRLRLESLRLTAGIVELVLAAEAVPATDQQLRLFTPIAQRDLGAVARAFARLRAELGDQAVVRARLVEAHLPGARFAWVPIESAVAPEPRSVAPRPLVRRIYDTPVALPPRPRQEPDGWLLKGLDHGPVSRLRGPYVVSGGWWRAGGGGVHREYYFAEMKSGDVLWIYYDRRRRRWLLEGRVE
jgi:protein ImuB